MIKHFYTLLLALLPATVFAQSTFTRPDRSFLHPESAEKAIAQTAKARPTATKRVARIRTVYNWNTSTGKWSETGTKYTTTYNSAGRPENTLALDSATSKPVSQTQLTFNTAGYVTSYLLETWNGSNWQNSLRYTASYNDNNLETDFLQQVWENGAWVNDYQDKITYDSYGNVTEEIYYDRTLAVNANWLPTHHARYTYTYTSAGVISEKVVETASNNDALTLNGRYLYTFPSTTSKFFSSYLYQRWENGTYVDNLKCDGIQRDSKNRITQQVFSFLNNGVWEITLRTLTTYSGDYGSEIVDQALNGNVWVDMSRMVSSYDSYNNHLGTTFAVWKNNIWATTAGTSYQLGYTDNAEIKSRIYKLFNVAANQFVNKTKTYYKDFAAVILAAKNTQQLNKLLQLAPNPASDQIIFKLAGLPMHELLTVEVFNSLGQSIQSFRLSPQKANQGHILDVSNLKAGVYSLRLLTSEGPITQRFVRE